MAAGDGLVSMKPTSIAHSGTSASINADGGVDFTAVTELSLNGVFTSDYDNYLVVLGYDCSVDTVALQIRLRVSGADATAANYARQYLQASGTSVGALRLTGATNWAVAGGDVENGETIHIYGAFLAQPTAYRHVSTNSYTSGQDREILDNAGTHSLSTSYDGFTLFPDTGSITGNIHVFGYEE
jgi:hypothetical protein